MLAILWVWACDYTDCRAVVWADRGHEGCSSASACCYYSDLGNRLDVCRVESTEGTTWDCADPECVEATDYAALDLCLFPELDVFGELTLRELGL